MAAFHLDPRDTFANFLEDTLQESNQPKSSYQLEFYNKVKEAITDHFIDKENINNNNTNDHADENIEGGNHDIILNDYADPSKSLFRWDKLYWKYLYYYFI